MITEEKLSGAQQQAVELCCDLLLPIVGVTGGAGTGKSTILQHVHRELRARRSVALCAPTGRAAKRIQELTNIPATTIHRLLEFPMPDELLEAIPGEPQRNRQRPLDQTAILVDEASMLAPTLFRQLMDALRPGAVIRFIGDNNQLPPVESGIPPFFDILERFPSVELHFNFRSGDDIVANSLRIINGQIPKRNDRFQIVYTNEPVPTLIKMIERGDIESFDPASPRNQIIMPTRRGKVGTLLANPSIQLRVNPDGPALRLGRFDDKEANLLVRPKDKFLWVKNDYQLNLFNGETGTITDLDVQDGGLDLLTGDRVEAHVPARLKFYNSYMGHMVNYDPRKQLELGYAITTHKAQGSEFDTVVYCMAAPAGWLLGRRNFYTGITRARDRVIVITDRTAMSRAVKPERAH